MLTTVAAPSVTGRQNTNGGKLARRISSISLARCCLLQALRPRLLHVGQLPHFGTRSQWTGAHVLCRTHSVKKGNSEEAYSPTKQPFPHLRSVVSSCAVWGPSSCIDSCARRTCACRTQWEQHPAPRKCTNQHVQHLVCADTDVWAGLYMWTTKDWGTHRIIEGTSVLGSWAANAKGKGG